MQQLHASGARTIIVGNQPPQGCSASILTPFLRTGPYDTIGCLDEYNKVNRVFNTKLKQALTNLQESYKTDGTLIIQFDFYNALIELFTNPAQYGISILHVYFASHSWSSIYDLIFEIFQHDLKT